MDNREESGGEGSYEEKMEKVLEDLIERPSIQNKKYCIITEKICKQGRDIINEMQEKAELNK